MKNPLSAWKAEHFVLWGGIVTLFAGGLLLAQRPRSLGYDPEHEKLGSSRYTTPGGAKALYTLLRSVQLPVRRHEREISLLPESARTLLVLSTEKALEEADCQFLEDWVVSGGTLLWCPRPGGARDAADRLLKRFGLGLIAGPGHEASVEGSLRSFEHSLDRPYLLWTPGEFRLSKAEAPGILTLAADGAGGVVVVASRGSGRMIAVAEPSLASNLGIARGENAEFMVHLVWGVSGGDHPVFFDEFHHGFQEGQSAYAIVMDSPLRGAVVVLVLAGFAGVFARGRRLGPAVDLHEERRRRPAEFLEAFAGLCRKMKAAPQILTLILAEFRLDLKRRLGASTPEALERAALRAGLEARSVTRTLDRIQREAKAPGLDDGTLVSSCRQLEALRASLCGSRTPRKSP